ncbi:MAG: hypothetical protein IPH28_08055 [Cytophagaceae bacterium]|nr:hypothetical protein [Cytophagaceae bacterium]
MGLLIWLIFFHGLTWLTTTFLQIFSWKKKFLYRDIEKYDFTEDDSDFEDSDSKEDTPLKNLR